MKKILLVFALFAAMLLMISCGGGSKSGDTTDTGEVVTDGDTTDSGSTDNSDSDTTQDGGDSKPDSDSGNDVDSGDTAPDSDPSEPVNENPDNLPECSPASATPCIDSETGLIWSGKSAEKMHWTDAIDYCKNINEGAYSDWRLPSEEVLGSLVQNCILLNGCEGDTEGKYSKFGDIVFLWSSTGGNAEATIAYGVYFYNGARQTKNVDESFNARCVRRDNESRKVQCTEIPEHAEYNTVSEITQTWDWDQMWKPAPTSRYNEEPSTTQCRFKCEEKYFYGSGKCLNPCDSNSCGEHSDVLCTATSSTAYSCECSGGYYWHGKTEGCKTEPATLGNICTGQNKCYANSGTMTCPAEGEDFFGQDAWYANLGKCTSQSFTVQTISNQKVVVNNNTGLMWQQTIPTDTYEWALAFSYCNFLSYAGYSDWRLPTPQELLTIVDNSKYNPAIDITYFPNTPSSYFWSSSSCVNYQDNAWYVNFDSGSVLSYSKTSSSRYVRCVRGDESLPSSAFEPMTVNGDVIVTDTKTGLIWQKTYETDKTWQQALDYCENLTYAGYSDWRLPDKNELASLVNYVKYNPASDFPDMPSKSFRSSSTKSDDTSYAWYVDFGNGAVVGSDKDNSHNNGNYYYVRCVR